MNDPDALQLVYGDSGVGRVCNVLAAYLLQYHHATLGPNTITSTRAAALVAQKLGSDWHVGCPPGLELWQILEGRPGFAVEDVRPGEKAVRLDVKQLQQLLDQLLPGQQTQQQQQQQQQQDRRPEKAAYKHPYATAQPPPPPRRHQSADPSTGAAAATAVPPPPPPPPRSVPSIKKHTAVDSTAAAPPPPPPPPPLWRQRSADAAAANSAAAGAPPPPPPPFRKQRSAAEMSAADVAAGVAPPPPPSLGRRRPATSEAAADADVAAAAAAAVAAGVPPPPPPPPPVGRHRPAHTAAADPAAADVAAGVPPPPPPPPPSGKHQSADSGPAAQSVAAAVAPPPPPPPRRQQDRHAAATQQQQQQQQQEVPPPPPRSESMQPAPPPASLRSQPPPPATTTAAAAETGAAVQALRPSDSSSWRNHSTTTTITTSSGTSFSGEALLLAVQRRWGCGGRSGADQVKASLARHLVTAREPRLPAYTVTCATAGQLVVHQLGKDWRQQLGVSQTLRELARGDSCLVVEVHHDDSSGKPSDCIRLHVQELVRLHGAPTGGLGRTSNSSSSSSSNGSSRRGSNECAGHGPPASASAGAGAAGTLFGDAAAASSQAQATSFEEALPLVAAIACRWGREGPASVLRELATHMVTTPDPQLGQYQLTGARAGSFVFKRFGSSWKEVAGVSSIQQLLSSSAAGGCFVVEPHGSELAVRLNTEVLLAGGSSSSSSSSSSSLVSSSAAAEMPLSHAASGPNAAPGVTAAAAAVPAPAGAPESTAADGARGDPPKPSSHGGSGSSSGSSGSKKKPWVWQQPAWQAQLLQQHPDGCEEAPMVLIDMAQPAAAWELLLDRCLHHMSCCSVVGMACQYVTSLLSSGGASSRRSSSHSPDKLQLEMVQVFAPATNTSEQAAGSGSSSSRGSSSGGGSGSFAGCIYLLALPDDQEVTQPVMQQLLGPLLTSQQLVKVMHDPRQDAAVLQQQYGVELQGVLDTALLAGVVAAADGTSAGGRAAQGSHALAAADAGSKCLQLIAQAVSSHRDITIDALYQQYGFDNPHKRAVHAMFDQDDRLWYRRPLTTQLLACAADDVRYLLPVAAALLQQLPAAALGFSNAVLAG